MAYSVMGMQVTASNIDLLLSCSRPFDPDVETERSEPGVSANYGSAFHAIMHGDDPFVTADKFGVREYLATLKEHAVKAGEALNIWMAGANSFEKVFQVVLAEEPTAYSPWTGARTCEFDEATHHYVLLPGEIGGTADLVLESSDGFRVVLDFKTGDYVNPDVYQNGQLQTLARMHSAHGVVIMYTPRSSPIQFYVADYDPSHWDKVQKALDRIGDGSLRPTPSGCKYCPAKSSCPAFGADIVKEANSLLRLASGAAPLVEPTDAGALHQFLSKFAFLEKRARELIRMRVEVDGEVIQRPDGKVLGLYPKKFTNLSLASIRRAMPGEGGEEMIKVLRHAGCIEEGERLELHAK